MVQSIWLNFEKGHTATEVFDGLKSLYGIASIKELHDGHARRWDIKLKDTDFIMDFLVEKRIRDVNGRRTFLPSRATTPGGLDSLTGCLEWYGLTVSESTADAGLALGRSVFQADQNLYPVALKVLGYSLRIIKRDLEEYDNIKATLDFDDTDSCIRQSVMHYKLLSPLNISA